MGFKQKNTYWIDFIRIFFLLVRSFCYKILFCEVEHTFYYNQQLWRENWQVQAGPTRSESVIFLLSIKWVLLNSWYCPKYVSVLHPKDLKWLVVPPDCITEYYHCSNTYLCTPLMFLKYFLDHCGTLWN